MPFVQLRVNYDRCRSTTSSSIYATPGLTLQQFYVDVVLPLLRKQHYQINELQCDQDNIIAYASSTSRTNLFNRDEQEIGHIVKGNWILPNRSDLCLLFNLGYDHLSSSAKRFRTLTQAEYELCVGKEAIVASHVLWTIAKTLFTSWLIRS